MGVSSDCFPVNSVVHIGFRCASGNGIALLRTEPCAIFVEMKAHRLAHRQRLVVDHVFRLKGMGLQKCRGFFVHKKGRSIVYIVYSDDICWCLNTKMVRYCETGIIELLKLEHNYLVILSAGMVQFIDTKGSSIMARNWIHRVPSGYLTYSSHGKSTHF